MAMPQTLQGLNPYSHNGSLAWLLQRKVANRGDLPTEDCKLHGPGFRPEKGSLPQIMCETRMAIVFACVFTRSVQRTPGQICHAVGVNQPHKSTCHSAR